MFVCMRAKLSMLPAVLCAAFAFVLDIVERMVLLNVFFFH